MRRYALVLLTSGGRSDGLYRELFDDAASAIDGSRLPAPLLPGENGGPLAEGTYRSGGASAVIAGGDDGPTLAVTEFTDILRTGAEPEIQTMDLVSSTFDGVWAFTSPDLGGWAQVRAVDGGLYMGYRFLPVAVTS